MTLPKLPHTGGAARLPLLRFYGLDRRAGAGNGAICDMTNMSGADVPVLASRPKRKSVRAQTKPHGLFAAGALFEADGTVLRRDGVSVGTVTDTDKTFAALGERVLVFPDKKLWTAAGGLQDLGATYTASGLVFSDGSYAGVSAEKNSVTTALAAFPFRVGDGVTIPACAPTGNADKTAVVREISADGKTLRFYENTFVENGTVSASLTLTRSIPDLDFLCTVDNRVWGCKGDTVCCCKLGDPTNWNVFDGLSTDAWSVETGTPGDFTGCVSFMGYPVFFKEDRVFKVYGSRPGNFELMGSATLGVLPGADKTLAVAGETLYYLSRAGFVRYNGGYPSAVDAALDAKYTGGAAGSDGKKYYVSAVRGSTRDFLAFDSETGLWHREDSLAAGCFASLNGTLYAQAATALWTVGAAADANEADFESSVTFADLDLDGSFSGKYPVRLWLRMENAGAVTVQISYNGGSFETAATISAATGKAVSCVPVPIRRCDRFRVKLSTTGAWKLYGMEIETRAERTRRP